MEVLKNAQEDFVTVVSVGNSQEPESFVTVLSIGSEKKDILDDADSIAGQNAVPRGQGNGADAHLEEEVEVFRLPGERLGFGLKFEGGNKTSERVRRLFVQSCADESPASRAKCSWGTLGEGDEVLSIDGVPVTHMTRLDCVRRLKESQLVIKLLVRYRGALRPEVVSAERKCSPEKSKVPPELPTAPPPVPPRKLRQPRGPADGEANPSPVKKTWDATRSVPSSQNGSPQSQNGFRDSSSKSTSYESCSSSPKNANGSKNGSPKGSPKECSPELTKSRKEPPEAKVYLDARSQDASSTHGSTSDDTGSSMSTVVDRFSTSDRFSTVSTTSTASNASEHYGDFQKTPTLVEHFEKGLPKELCRNSPSEPLDLTRVLGPFDQLERDFTSNPPDYLLTRLANSEAVTFVESLGEGGVLERVTAVVAPNTVLIEEIITLQPPLSFQDAPLSYGHETRPGLVYTDLAADSTTHFRPIKDDAAIVDSVNGNVDQEEASGETRSEENLLSKFQAPPLPARNHVNRISINQNVPAVLDDVPKDVSPANLDPLQDLAAPLLPPKPLPRKDIKTKRKRPPPPPPPTAVRREIPPLPPGESVKTEDEKVVDNETERRREIPVVEKVENDQNSVLPVGKIVPSGRTEENTSIAKDVEEPSEVENVQVVEVQKILEIPLIRHEIKDEDDDERSSQVRIEEIEHDGVNISVNRAKTIKSTVLNTTEDCSKTNKVLEIIEMKKAKAFSDVSPQRSPSKSYERHEDAAMVEEAADKTVEQTELVDEKIQVRSKFSNELDLKVTEAPLEEVGVFEKNETVSPLIEDTSPKEDRFDNPKTAVIDENLNKVHEINVKDVSPESGADAEECQNEKKKKKKKKDNLVQTEVVEEGSYRSLDEVGDDLKNSEANRVLSDEEVLDDSTDESDLDDYYWQSNLATIGEEEETNSLEYTNANRSVNDSETQLKEGSQVVELFSDCSKDVSTGIARDEVDCVKIVADHVGPKAKSLVNGRMESCGGGQRLPPDGDEFPSAYQEFNTTQYQFVTATRTTTLASNGGLVCGESQAFASSETFKLLPEECKNNVSSEKTVVSEKSILLPDNRVISMNMSVGVNAKDSSLPPSESLSSKRHRSSSSENSRKNSTASIDSYSSYGSGSLEKSVISEKKIEIAGYHPKDTKNEARSSNDCPPPLPTTRPPKVEVFSPPARNLTLEPLQRKFSLNVELWRQDDKSEKSVRDKIAMFSSQSSLEAPLFPSSPTTPVASSNGRRLSKHKSSEDVFAEDKKIGSKEKIAAFAERAQSSVDLTSSSAYSSPDSSMSSMGDRGGQALPSLPQSLPPLEDIPHANLHVTTGIAYSSKPAPPLPQKASSSVLIANRQETKPGSLFNSTGSHDLPNHGFASIQPTQLHRQMSQPVARNHNSLMIPSGNEMSPTVSSTTSLTRATSFSGGTSGLHARSQSLCELPPSPQISRTNSLASTFRRPNEDMRRTSLNQLIEQRRKGISKLRGLVIPEKETLPVAQPIIDLPEIKSRDSILSQVPRANIQDKWGSQSSLASNASTVSISVKSSASFKMPAPQNLPKYSPAFKRKSLTVCGSSSTTGSSLKTSPVHAPVSEAPKSLESITSPTRSDYSFEFVSSSASLDAVHTTPKSSPRKTRADYDDSDNDSAVSSSQSSMSRGFSPPMSPAPSERSTLSSERSFLSTDTNYLRPSALENSSRDFICRESRAVASERSQFASRPSIVAERSYLSSERSSSSSSSPDPRSPDIYSRRSLVLQQQSLKRSSSTDTNCSTSSTLTSGSQASAESLSRRVLKPQSVEAINRKNILASAKCRSGRDLNGSPLIQRKFSDDEEVPVSKLAQENGSCVHHQHSRSSNGNNNHVGEQDVKIAYIDVDESILSNENSDDVERDKIEPPALPPKRSLPFPAARAPKPEVLEPSDDLKKWVHSEAKALANLPYEKQPKDKEEITLSQRKSEVQAQVRVPRSRSSLVLDDKSVSDILTPRSRSSIAESDVLSVLESATPRSRSSLVLEKSLEDQNDLLTVLATKSRSRSTIHVEERSFGRLKTQMSLEAILDGKSEPKQQRTRSVAAEEKPEKNGVLPGVQSRQGTGARDNRQTQRTSSNDMWTKEKTFLSKIPTPERPKIIDNSEEVSEKMGPKSPVSKIPMPRALGRRSVSVTDMKKALEKAEVNSQTGSSANNHLQVITATHNRFPSLDSSVEESPRTICAESDAERYSNEQFGSISSLASSTSLISQQELAQLVEEASLEEARGSHDVVVVLLHKENPGGSVGIALAGGVDCEAKEITVHRVLAHSIADKDGRVQRGDRILSINGKSTRGLSHRESLAVLKQPRSEVVLVVSRARDEGGCRLRSRTESVETIVEGPEVNGGGDETAWGPPAAVAIFKDGAGLGFSLEGGRDSPLGDKPLIIKKIFTGGAAEKTGALRAGDQLLEVNRNDVTRMSRIEAWSLMKKLQDGEVSLLVRHPAAKSS